MNDRQFDNIIKGKIGEYDSPVSPTMWDRISPREKRRRIFALWWIVGGAGLVFGVLFFRSGKVEHTSNEKIVAKAQMEESSQKIAGKTTARQKTSTRDITNKETSTQNITAQSSSNKIVSTERRSTQTIATQDIAPKKINKTENATDQLIKPFLSLYPAVYEKPVVAGPKTLVANLFPGNDSSTSVIPCPVWNKINPWFAEIFTGPTIGFRNVELPGANLGEDGRTTTNISIQSGFYIGKYIHERFYLKTGLSLSSMSIKENYTTDSLAAFSMNSHNLLDVPLIAGYAMTSGKVKVNLQAGIIVTAHSWVTGFRTDNAVKSTGIRTHTSLNILYPLGQKLSVLLEPYYIRQLTNMSAQPDFINLKMHQVGLSIGARYTIPNRQRH